MTKQNRTALGLVAAIFLAGAGCDEVTEPLQEEISSAARPEVRVFSADQRTTYDSARAALGQIGFHFVRGGPAGGELEALSGLETGDTEGSTEQFSLKVRLSPTPEGTEVSLWFKEIIEGDSEHRQGFATETPMKDTPLYETYFRAIQQGLGKGEAGK
jgi:hypothetical protein